MIICGKIHKAAMKIFRNSITVLTFAAIVAMAMLGSGCEYVRKVIAKDKLNQGAILYNQGRTKQAQEFFREAKETDPTNSVAWLYYGATLVKEYKEPNIEDQKKKEIANQAIGVYEKALELSGNNCVAIDNAISYLATIYDDLNNDEEWRKWMEKRAESECSKNDVKAQSYYSIAQRYWQCSYDETTRYADKVILASQPFHYRNMDYAAAIPDKQKAEQCVVKGLEYMEKALSIDPEYVDAMYYKGLLYRERQKLTKEEAKRKELDQLAVKIANEASATQKRKEAAAQQKEQEQAAPKG
jgi:tetratricopeptide (TPR) repeat protein